jgi:hypothetical protein
VPFEAADLPGLLWRVAADLPPRPTRVNPGLPPGLEAVCLKCLEKDPADRLPTAAGPNRTVVTSICVASNPGSRATRTGTEPSAA